MNKPKRTIKERMINAEVMSGKWLADGNVAKTKEKADKCYAKAQFWLDKANKLAESVK